MIHAEEQKLFLFDTNLKIIQSISNPNFLDPELEKNYLQLPTLGATKKIMDTTNKWHKIPETLVLVEHYKTRKPSDQIRQQRE